MKAHKEPETPKVYHNPSYGKDASEKAKAAGFNCEYVDGRPVFYVDTERQRQAVYKWCKENWNRTFAVYPTTTGGTENNSESF